MAKGKFEHGNPGKPKGAKNKLTKTVKEAVLIAFNELQGDSKANLVAWGKQNPGAFYQVAAKLIPTELGLTLPPETKLTIERRILGNNPTNIPTPSA